MSCSLNVVSEKALERVMRYSGLYRNMEKQAEKTCSPRNRLTSNRSNIDAQMSFYGTYILMNEQVTLQAQDPNLEYSVKA